MGMVIDKGCEALFVSQLNDIIDNAVIHGGDSGGAYFSNTDGLIGAMRYFLKWTGLNKTVGIMNNDGKIQFYIKSSIVE